MTPKFVQKEAMLLLGQSFYGDPFQFSTSWTEGNEIGRLWQRLMGFMQRYKEHLPQPLNPNTFYEVHIESAERETNGHYEVFVGFEIRDIPTLPVESLIKKLPSTHYAVFTLKGTQINSDWTRQIYDTWLPGSGYAVAHGYNFQLYDQRFKGLDQLDASTLDVYVPVKQVKA